MKTEIPSDDELSILGYTRNWITFGILSVERLKEQIREYQLPDSDPNLEHYRYGAFNSYLKQKGSFTDEEIDNYLNLTLDDEDYLMARAAVHDLVSLKTLTDVQFESLPNHSAFTNFEMSRYYSRYRLYRLLRKGNLTDELIHECLFSNDREVQRVLLYYDLPRDAVVYLAENGLNKAIRNIAKQLLKSRKYRRSKND